MRPLLLAAGALILAAQAACGPAPRCRWVTVAGGELEVCETRTCRDGQGRFVRCP